MASENASTINIQLVDSLIQAIQSLSPAEQFLLDQKLYAKLPEPSTQELIQLADRGVPLHFCMMNPISTASKMESRVTRIVTLNNQLISRKLGQLGPQQTKVLNVKLKHAFLIN